MSLTPADNPAQAYDINTIYRLTGTGGGYHLWGDFDIGSVGQNATKDWFYENGRYDNADSDDRAPLPPKTTPAQNQGSLADGQLFRIVSILYQAYKTKRGVAALPEGTYMCAQVTMLSGPHAGSQGFIWLIYNDHIIFASHAPECAIKAYEHAAIELTCGSQLDPFIVAHSCVHAPYLLAEQVTDVRWHVPTSGGAPMVGNRRVYRKIDDDMDIVGVAARDEVYARLDVNVATPAPEGEQQPVARVRFRDASNGAEAGHNILLPITPSPDDPTGYQARVTARDFQDILQRPASVFSMTNTYEDDAYRIGDKLDNKQVPPVISERLAEHHMPLSNKRLVKKLLPEGEFDRWLLIDKKHNRRFTIQLKLVTDDIQQIEYVTVSRHAARLNHTLVRATVEPERSLSGSVLESDNLAYPVLQHAIYFLPDAFGSSLFVDKGGDVREAYPRGLKPRMLQQFNQFVSTNEAEVEEQIVDWYNSLPNDLQSELMETLANLPTMAITLVVNSILLPIVDTLAGELAETAQETWEEIRDRIRTVLETHELADLACQPNGLPSLPAQTQRLKLPRTSHLSVLGIPTYQGLEDALNKHGGPPIFLDPACTTERQLEHTVFSDIPYDWRLPSDHTAPDIASQFQFLTDAACAIQHTHTRSQSEVFRVNLGSSYLSDLYDEHLLIASLNDLQANKIPRTLSKGFEARNVSLDTPVSSAAGTQIDPWIVEHGDHDYKITLDRFRLHVTQSSDDPGRLKYPFLDRRATIVAHGLGGLLLRGLVSLENPLRHRIGRAFFIDAELWGSPRGMIGCLSGDLFDNLLSIPVYRPDWQSVALTWPASYYMWPTDSQKELVGSDWSMPGQPVFEALGMYGYQDELRTLSNEYRARCEQANPLVTIPTYLFHTDGLPTTIDQRSDSSAQQLKTWFQDRRNKLSSPDAAIPLLVINWITGVDIIALLDQMSDAIEVFTMQRRPVRAPLGDGARTTVTQIADVGDWANAAIMRSTPADPSYQDAASSDWVWQRIFKVLSRVPLVVKSADSDFLDPAGVRSDEYDILEWQPSLEPDALYQKLKDYVLTIARERWQAAGDDGKDTAQVPVPDALDPGDAVRIEIHGGNHEELSQSVVHIRCIDGPIAIETSERWTLPGSSWTPMSTNALDTGEEWLTGMSSAAYEPDKVFKLRLTPSGPSDYHIVFLSWED